LFHLHNENEQRIPHLSTSCFPDHSRITEKGNTTTSPGPPFVIGILKWNQNLEGFLKPFSAGTWWLIPLILATWEAGIQRMWFEDSQVKKLVRLHLNEKQLDVVMNACHPCYGRKLQIEGSCSRLA
jgi:hypothetical protein